MRLDPDELRDLAAFCARRFPDAEARAGLARQAGVDGGAGGDAVAAWSEVLGRAQDAGRLTALARALAAAAPGDANLQAACAALTEPAGGGRGRVVIGVGVALALAVGGWLAFGRGGPEEAPGTSPTAAPPSAATAPVASPEAPVASPEAPVASPEAPPAPVPASAPPASAPTPATSATTASSPAPPPGATGCDALPGPVVGWWYAGEASPGAQGEVITLPRDARVRADYPRADNGHDSRAPERCVLPRGARVRLSQAPVDASRGRWWVPYAPGDLVR